MRFEVNGTPGRRRARPRAGAADAAARAGARRGEEGLRLGRLRRVHGPARRAADALLPGPRVPGVGPCRHHGLRAGPAGGRRPSSTPPRSSAGSAPPGMVTTVAGLGLDDGRRRDRPPAQGQPLPLHRLPLDLRRRRPPPQHGRPRGRPGRRPVRALARGAPDRHRARAVHARRPRHRPGPPRRPGQPARPRAHRVDRHHRRPAQPPACWPSSPTRTPPPPCSRPPATRAASTTPTTPACSTRCCGSTGSASPSSSPSRCARRRGRCALIEVEYEVLPAVVDPEEARQPGAPLVHGDKGPEARISEPGRNVVAQLHAEMGSVAEALAASAHRVGGTYRTSRVSHAALETHATRGWLDEDGRLVLRTSTQVPYLVRDEIAHIFALDPAQRPRAHRSRRRRVRRQAGAAHRGRRRARRAAHRPPGAVRDDPGRRVHHRAQPAPGPRRGRARCRRRRRADRDAHRRPHQHRRLRQPRARASCSTASASRWRCTGAPTSGSTPSPSTRTRCRRARSAGTGSGRSSSRSSRRWTTSRGRSASPRSTLRRRNVVVPGDRLLVADPDEVGDLDMHSYGMDQCLDLVEAALADRSADLPAPPGTLVGSGTAVAMIATIAPRGHYAEASVRLLDDGRYEVERRHHRVRQRHHDRARPAGRPGARHHRRPHRDPAVRHRRDRVRHRRVRVRGRRRRRPRPAPRRPPAAHQDPLGGRRPARPPERRTAHLGRPGPRARRRRAVCR